MNFFKSRSKSYAIGFPANDAVTARRLRRAGDVFHRSGAVVLTNGSNAFTVDVSPYKRVSIAPADGGEYQIVGHDSLGTSGSGTVLAQFGSEMGATNGYAALLRAHAGVRVRGPGGSVGAGVLKWGGSVVGLFVFVVIAISAASPMNQEAVASAAPPMRDLHDLAQKQVAGIPPTAAGFNPNEPSLDDLTAGNYQFRPQIKAPDIQVPALNCAPH